MSLSRSLRGILVLLAFIGLLAMWPASHLQASELEDCSIRLIPADAAFYAASLRNGEQLKIIAESKRLEEADEHALRPNGTRHAQSPVGKRRE